MILLLIIAIIIVLLNLLFSSLLLLRFRWAKAGPVVWALKSYTAAFSFWLALASLLAVTLGWLSHSWFVELAGSWSAIIFLAYLSRINTQSFSSGMEKIFGKGWQYRIPTARSKNFLPHPTAFRLPADTAYELRQDIVFATVPGSDRQLLCDLWLPAKEVQPSGLAFIYLHGGAWYYLDKDLATRPFFRHLASQGHVVMDVAYRMFPETDMTGMVQDTKRAIAWMKNNALAYHVDPQQIVIGGGSAGGHLALLAGYLPDSVELNPPELQDNDLSVHAVISLYGPSYLEALYYHCDQHITTKLKPGDKPGEKKIVPDLSGMEKMMGKNFRRFQFNKPPADGGSMPAILGCHPDVSPGRYALYSPITHVRKGCPATLILQGEHDMFTPADAALRLYNKLQQANVPAILQMLPQTDHAFDLFAPRSSPVAHTAFYMAERFLALV